MLLFACPTLSHTDTSSDKIVGDGYFMLLDTNSTD